MSIADEVITQLRKASEYWQDRGEDMIATTDAERIIRACLKDVEAGRRLVMAEDIELWDGPTLHGQWTPRVVAVEPRFWERCGAWLLEGKAADLRALLDGTYTSDDTRLIATLTGELDAERVKVAALEDKIERMIRVAKVAADASTESRAAAKAEGAAKERERIADAIEAVSDDEERTAIVGGVIYVQINPCLAACAPPEGGR